MGYQLEPGIREPWCPGWPEGMEHSAIEKSNILLFRWQVLKRNNHLICNDRGESAERLKDELFFLQFRFSVLGGKQEASTLGATDFSCAAHGFGL